MIRKCMRDFANVQVFIYMKLNSFITDFKWFCFVIVLGALYHTELSNVFLSSFSYLCSNVSIKLVKSIKSIQWIEKSINIDYSKLFPLSIFIDCR